MRWCFPEVATDALPRLVDGLTALASDPEMEAVVDRGINHVFAANGDEVLDVRIPITCSGIELMAWATLQRHLSLSRKELEEMSAAEMTSRMLDWARIPKSLPEDFSALKARRLNRNPDWSGPDVLFSVRNRLVHPPPRLTDAEWPNVSDHIVRLVATPC